MLLPMKHHFSDIVKIFNLLHQDLVGRSKAASLFRQIGTDFRGMGAQGLTYSVSGGWDSPIDHPGLFAAGGETARPAEFLDQLQRVLRVSFTFAGRFALVDPLVPPCLSLKERPQACHR